MSLELKKRIVTSIFLFLLLICMFIDQKFLIFSLIAITLISSFEFFQLLRKIFGLKNILTYISITLFFSYILIFSLFFYLLLVNPNTTYFIILTLLICIMSDIGGLTFGKIFKGKKLTRISPNKTVAGSIGSFIFSIILLLIFIKLKLISLSLGIVIYALSTSLFCQIGDIFISYLKRKAKIKDTGILLPGHGGFLDRIDGILLGFPLRTFVFFLTI